MVTEQFIARILGSTHKPKIGTIEHPSEDDRKAICECCDKVITSFYRDPEEDRLGGWSAWRVQP